MRESSIKSDPDPAKPAADDRFWCRAPKYRQTNEELIREPDFFSASASPITSNSLIKTFSARETADVLTLLLTRLAIFVYLE